MDLVIAAAVNYAISYAVTSILAQDSTVSQEGARLDNLNAVGSSYGAPIPLVFGRMRLITNMIWSRPLREVITTTSQSVGGKGGGGSTTVNTTTYTYFANFANLISQGTLSRPVRIWADKKLIWQAPDGATVLAGELVDGGTFEFFTGEPLQGRSSVIQAVLGEATPAYRGRAYIAFADVPVDVYGRRIPAIEIEVESASTPQAADIIGYLCNAVGLLPAQVDTSTVSAGVWGAKLSTGPAGQSIESVLLGTGTQVVYDGAALAFRPIEQPVAVEIPQGDLLAGDARFPITRLREDDLPKSISISHIDPARDYQAGSQHATRHLTQSVQEVALSVPVAINASQAHALCDSLLYRAWTARVRYGPFGLPPKYLYLEPGDVVGITVDARRHLVRISTITLGANGALEVEGEAYDASVLVGVAGGGDSGAFPGPI